MADPETTFDGVMRLGWQHAVKTERQIGLCRAYRGAPDQSPEESAAQVMTAFRYMRYLRNCIRHAERAIEAMKEREAAQ
jgi:hypothetical protein